MRAILGHRGFLAGAAVLLVSAVALNFTIAALRLHLRKLPIEAEQKTNALVGDTKNWTVVHEWREKEEVVEELGTENYLNRIYRRNTPDEKGRPVSLQLHLAYYTGMVDTVPHVPERCMVGGGWEIDQGPFFPQVPLDVSRWSIDEDATAEFGSPQAPIRRGRLANGQSVRLPSGIEDLKLNCTIFRQPKGDGRLVAGYFFIANGGISTTAEGVRLLAFDLRTDYAFYLKVQISSERARTAEELAKDAASLLEELLPDIMLCAPDWIEVQRGNYPKDNPRRRTPPGGAGAQ